ncbi:MAG: chromate efflux transporter [Chitinophagaceae bacterium]
MEMNPKKNEYSLLRLILYFLKLGTTGFGGPIALLGYMHDDLVEKRGWLTEEEYLRGLALSQISPGPLAAQFAIYIGYIKNKLKGATLVGIAFVLPSFLMVLALGMLYKSYNGLPWVQTLFYGIGAAVIAIIAKSAYKLARTTCTNKKGLWIIFFILFAITAITAQEVIWFLLLGGIAGILLYDSPKFGGKIPTASAILAAWPISGDHLNDLKNIFFFFLKAGIFVFGSGLAIIPFLHMGVVQQFHWLNEHQFLDAVAVAMITPGPVVITVGFIGYLVGSFTGALVAAIAIFFPVWLIIVIATPFYERVAHNSKIKAFVAGITAATAGAIAGAVVILGKGSIKDIPTTLIALGTLGLLMKYKIPEPIIIVIAGIVGLLLSYLKPGHA